jgi:addiction module RelE/StbE family toxin
VAEAMKLEWSLDALADLDRFAAFLHDKFPSLAAVVARTLIEKSHILTSSPELGRPLGEHPGFRQLVVHALHAVYVLQYRVEDDRIVILRVFHGREMRS